MIVHEGMGDVPNSAIISQGVAVTGGGIAAAASAGLLTSIGIGASVVPIIGPIVGGLTLLIGALGIGNGCGPTCTASTQVVNTIEPYMKQNVQAAQQQAQANGGCLTASEAQALVSNFQQLWNYVSDNCNKVGGVGGKQCIEDRQRGGKWDWFSYYLDPINAIPVCAASSSASILSSSVGGVSLPLVLGMGLIAALVLGSD